jgi:type IV fimbrial biogenesis protein FimT
MVEAHMRTVANSSGRNRGFTLTEALVVTALIGVLFAAAAPQMGDLVMESRLKQASVEMFSAMAYARSEAVSRDAPVSISAVGSWSNGWQVSVGNTILKRSDPISSITVSGPAANTITYNPNGRLPAGQPIRFTFSVPGNTRTITRCVISTLSGQPVLQADRNRDGDCSNG